MNIARRSPAPHAPRWRRYAAALGLAIGLLTPAQSQAWDPSTTHLGMVERSVLDSAMHTRWMDGSLLQRGLFTPLRLDPSRLDDDTRRALIMALRKVHAASGAQPLGGPGACPGASAPDSTRSRCVEGDLWETSALGWMELGVIVETVPAERLLHHFVDRTEPEAAQWSDDDLSPSLLRNKHAKVGATVAERFNGAGFEGSGRSAIAWLGDARDRWAPPALAAHLRRASLAQSRAERDHHLALALLCTGALMHVMQDLSVPAHARGDVSALFLPLSDIPGDRGLPLQELARDTFGRTGLPKPIALRPRSDRPATGIPLASTLQEHVLGGADYPGLVHFAGRMNFSESSLPAAQAISPDLDAEAAAAILLADAGLDASEREGARLHPWPSDLGYLQSGTGRPLAAYRVDDEGVHLWLDRVVYRAQMQQLIPAGVEAGRSVLDLVYAQWPTTEVDPAARALTITPGETWRDATLIVMLEDQAGDRRAVGEVALQGPGAHRIEDAWPADVPPDTQVVVVLRNRADQLPTVAERLVKTDVEAKVAAPTAVPRPRATPTTTKAATATPKRSGPVTSGTVAPVAADDGGTPSAASDASDDDAPPPATPDDAPPIEDVAADGPPTP